MARNATDDKPKPKSRRVKLAEVIDAGLEALGVALGWELRKRRGKPELYVKLDNAEDNLTSAPSEK